MGWSDWWLGWRNWFRPRRLRIELVLYTRQGCHLCEQAWRQLRQAQRRYGFTLTTVNVDTDAELEDRYGLQVPVVTVNGRVRFRGGVNAVLLERLLQAEADRRGRP